MLPPVPNSLPYRLSRLPKAFRIRLPARLNRLRSLFNATLTPACCAPAISASADTTVAFSPTSCADSRHRCSSSLCSSLALFAANRNVFFPKQASAQSHIIPKSNNIAQLDMRNEAEQNETKRNETAHAKTHRRVFLASGVLLESLYE